MLERIRKHRLARDERSWHTIEEQLDIAEAIDSSREFPVVLVDCLTLWINNLMYRAEKENASISETDVAMECRNVIDAAKRRRGAVLFVTNEVGMGIIPENAQARLYRDLAGRCNQVFAEASDRVVLMVSGLPLEIKPGNQI
jgi:adenosylcobinamide kinase/adenosylcobinamide-phosphate guanylyltransferase